MVNGKENQKTQTRFQVSQGETMTNKTAPAESKTLQVDALGKLPAKTRCLHSRLYNNTEKAELGHAEGC